jgi:hypothetical protein
MDHNTEATDLTSLSYGILQKKTTQVYTLQTSPNYVLSYPYQKSNCQQHIHIHIYYMLINLITILHFIWLFIEF